jgi:hypothetical protein
LFSIHKGEDKDSSSSIRSAKIGVKQIAFPDGQKTAEGGLPAFSDFLFGSAGYHLLTELGIAREFVEELVFEEKTVFARK